MKGSTAQGNFNRQGSVLVSFSLVLSLISCLASGYLYWQWRELSNEKGAFESVRIQLEDQIESLETDLETSLKAQKEFQATAETEKSEKDKTLKALEAANAASEALMADVTKLKKERDSLKKIAVQLKSQASALLPAAAATVPQGGTSVAETAPLQTSDQQAAGDMLIKTINRTFNFVVFDLAPGVTFRVGDEAVVERHGAWISDLKIKQVYAQYVSAEIRKEDDNHLLQIGDTVKRV